MKNKRNEEASVRERENEERKKERERREEKRREREREREREKLGLSFELASTAGQTGSDATCRREVRDSKGFESDRKG